MAKKRSAKTSTRKATSLLQSVDLRVPVVQESLIEPQERVLESLAVRMNKELCGWLELGAVTVDPYTSTPAHVSISEHSPRTRDGISEGAAVVAALRPLLGLEHAHRVQFVDEPAVAGGASGTTAIHFQQFVAGLRVVDMIRTLRLDAKGRGIDLTGCNAPVVAVPSRVPTGSAAAALDAIAAEVNLAGESVVIRGLPSLSRVTVLEHSGLDGPCLAELVWYWIEGQLTLAWALSLTIGETTQPIQAILNAQGNEEPPKVLWLDAGSRGVVEGRVFEHNPSIDRKVVSFPIAWADGKAPAWVKRPNPTPSAWVDERRTVGENVRALSKKPGGGSLLITARKAGSDLLFAPHIKLGSPQGVLNAFYFCNLMHDFFLLLGFDESAGNFERTSVAGVGGDPFRVEVYEQEIPHGASVTRTADGVSPRLRLGLSRKKRHYSLDATVVFHEYVHGVTDRIIGGPARSNALTTPQGHALLEGWSDYFALSFESARRGSPVTTIGSWAAKRKRGLRAYPYDEAFPDTFADLGSGRYVRTYPAAELWAATLLRIHRELAPDVPDSIERDWLIWQVVFEGWRMHPVPVGFLQARDDMFLALRQLSQAASPWRDRHTEIEAAMWRSFLAMDLGSGVRLDPRRLVPPTSGGLVHP